MFYGSNYGLSRWLAHVPLERTFIDTLLPGGAFYEYQLSQQCCLGYLYTFWGSAYCFINYRERNLGISNYKYRFVYLSFQIDQCFCLRYFEALLLGVWTLKTVMSSWGIDLSLLGNVPIYPWRYSNVYFVWN